MKKKIVFRRLDGGISITYVSPNDDYETMKRKHVPIGATILFEGEDIEIPVDRTDRDCWNFKNGKVVVDQDKLKVKNDAKKAKKDARDAILVKLGINEAELDHLLKG